MEIGVCPVQIQVAVEIQAGVQSERRAVAFLNYDEVKYVNVTEKFGKLKDNTRRTFNTRFDNWVAGFENRKHYHGWDKSDYGGEYQECYVFKASNDRLYGFLCHPKTPVD